MAWGDLRYDHSDIFKGGKPPPRRRKPPKRIMSRGIRIRKILEFLEGRQESWTSYRQIRDHLGITNQSGHLCKILINLCDAGEVFRERLGGTNAFSYRIARRLALP